MRLCGVCRKAPRGDDPLRRVQVNPSPEQSGYSFLVGMYGVEQCQGTIGARCCRACAAAITGEPAEPDPVYPWPGPVPAREGKCDSPIEVCGICRRAMYEDDAESHAHVRLAAEDLTDCPQVEPGGYRACRECVARFEPRIRRRLWAGGMFDHQAEHGRSRPAFNDIAPLSGNWLS